MAQRSASTALLLPQPFGLVRPGRMSSATGSAKVLKPAMRGRLTQAGRMSTGTSMVVRVECAGAVVVSLAGAPAEGHVSNSTTRDNRTYHA